MIQNKQLIHNVAIYMRLSKDDGDKEESESITNQRKIILEFMEKNFIYEKYYEYIDDGVSGATFNRPGFQKMISELKENKIELIITKNLARFGRNYIEAGEYIEKIFPNSNIRYIAILDRIDNYEDRIDNDFAPIKGVFNELYCKETSKNVKKSKKRRMLEGYYACTVAPYGYKKDLENPGKLVVDENAAEIVKRIFNMALEDKSCKQIADILNEEEIPTPSEYLNVRGLEKRTKKIWTRTCVSRILRNLVYLGKTVRGKSQSLSYKTRQRIYKNRSEQIIIDNTHEAIVSEEIYNKIHNNNNYGSTVKVKEPIVAKFSKYMYCEKCKEVMSRKKSRKHIKLHCSSLYEAELLCTNKKLYNYREIEGKIIERVQEKFNDYFNNNDMNTDLMQKYSNSKIEKGKNCVKKIESDIKKINFDISRLYNNRLLNKVTEDSYIDLYKENVQKRNELNKLKEMKEKEIEDLKNIGNDIERYEKVKDILTHLNEDTLTEEEIGEIIEKIEISESYIRILFTFADMNPEIIYC